LGVIPSKVRRRSFAVWQFHILCKSYRTTLVSPDSEYNEGSSQKMIDILGTSYWPVPERHLVLTSSSRLQTFPSHSTWSLRVRLKGDHIHSFSSFFSCFQIVYPCLASFGTFSVFRTFYIFRWFSSKFIPHLLGPQV
jgi:hypothetical protein